MNENTIPGEHEGEQDELFSTDPYDIKRQGELEGRKIIDAISAQVEQKWRENEAQQAVMNTQFKLDMAGLSPAEQVKARADQKIARIVADDAIINGGVSRARLEETSESLAATMSSADIVLALAARALAERNTQADEQRAAALPIAEVKQAHIGELLASFRENGTLPPGQNHSSRAQAAIDEARVNIARRDKERAPKNDKT